ncbi:family 43 glycosylhydrolase [Stieleria sp. TO1_6]|uniref:family 43 glycosylhydrolase n=1 Tax=Stieleria tagensis TaxID=2956795 RepID=UPI00209AD4D7|nr:family 43 glycosylhydrolase [Stieleria tagensis]MCO8123477.1 family 43 glycosylhydrolase [Stieleria tagensis]
MKPNYCLNRMIARLTSCCCIMFAVAFASVSRAQDTAIPQVQATYSEATGIGPQDGVMRRDPSDIIKVGDLFYVWYSKGPQSSGYNATIWYATSADGHQWNERGMSLPKGPPGSWDEHSVFTPNILVAENRYWLFYTAVPEPFIGKGPQTTPTAIGVAVSDSADGPWQKIDSNPVLKISDDHDDFDSLRVDDACLVVRDGKYWMYYKGRQWNKSPAETKLGLAVADKPAGPYVKHSGNPLIAGNHEVLVWPQGEGVAAMIGTVGPKSITRSIMYASDGLRFTKTHDVANVPTAAGAYRPEAFTDSGTGEPIQWGVHIGKQKQFLPFIERFELKFSDHQRRNTP